MHTTKVTQLKSQEMWCNALRETLSHKHVNIPRMVKMSGWNVMQSAHPSSLYYIKSLLAAPVWTVVSISLG
jgi:hypothetical protein